MLPAIVPSSGLVAETDQSILGMSVPIAGLVGDQQSALFGQGCVAPGMAKNTYGTGAFLLLYTGTEPPVPPVGLLATAVCDPRGALGHGLEGSVFIAGAAVQWLRDGLGLVATAAESEALARSVPDTGGVHFVPAFVGLGSPHWEPEARGTITGITRGTTRAHLVRAALEAIAFSSRDLIEGMLSGVDLALPELRVDGGAASNDWLLQFQADLLGVPVERPDCVETTALGAAALAGLAVGVWPDLDAFLSTGRFEVFQPRIDPATRATWVSGWARAVSTALHWAGAG
jgi:glycerol kinase